MSPHLGYTALASSEAARRVDGELTATFAAYAGARQGDALCTTLFNLVLGNSHSKVR